MRDFISGNMARSLTDASAMMCSLNVRRQILAEVDSFIFFWFSVGLLLIKLVVKMKNWTSAGKPF
jgi:hypothetical protein